MNPKPKKGLKKTVKKQSAKSDMTDEQIASAFANEFISRRTEQLMRNSPSKKLFTDMKYEVMYIVTKFEPVYPVTSEIEFQNEYNKIIDDNLNKRILIVNLFEYKDYLKMLDKKFILKKVLNDEDVLYKVIFEIFLLNTLNLLPKKFKTANNTVDVKEFTAKIIGTELTKK